jgi:hypothetical protein
MHTRPRIWIPIAAVFAIAVFTSTASSEDWACGFCFETYTWGCWGFENHEFAGLAGQGRGVAHAAVYPTCEPEYYTHLATAAGVLWCDLSEQPQNSTEIVSPFAHLTPGAAIAISIFGSSVGLCQARVQRATIRVAPLYRWARAQRSMAQRFGLVSSEHRKASMLLPKHIRREVFPTSAEMAVSYGRLEDLARDRTNSGTSDRLLWVETIRFTFSTELMAVSQF